jgi:hypothetical protein
VPPRALLAAAAKRSPQPEFAADADLSVPERVLQFCVASGTEWERAGVTGATVTVMIVRGLLRQLWALEDLPQTGALIAATRV